MPLYEFRCDTCGARFERLFRSSAQGTDGVVCPVCQSPHVVRLISMPAVITGSGSGAGNPQPDEESATVPKQLFGRKELNEALNSRQSSSD